MLSFLPFRRAMFGGVAVMGILLLGESASPARLACPCG